MTVRATPDTPKAPKAGTLCGGSPPYSELEEKIIAQWAVPQLGPAVFELVARVRAGELLGTVARDYGISFLEVEVLCLHHGVSFAVPRARGALQAPPARSFVTQSIPPGDQ